MNLAKLINELKAVCPLQDITIGTVENKSTWQIHFSPEANDSEKAAAQAVIDTADINTIFADVKEILKSEIHNRLKAIGKYGEAIQVLNSSAVTEEQRFDYINAVQIRIDDPQVIAVLQAIGVDPDTILY